MSLIASTSIAAATRLPGTMTGDSYERGWGSVLLRRYREPTEAEFETLPTSDQLLVMVRRGACSIERWSGRRWETARYVAGDLGMTPPEESTRLRFFGSTGHETLQLHIPAPLMAQAEELTASPLPRLDRLQTRSDVVAIIMRNLEAGLEAGAPAVYAEAAVHYLMMQMLADASLLRQRDRHQPDLNRLARVDAYIRGNLARAITLADMATDSGMSVFQLIRLCRSGWGTTPAARLTELRLEHGRTRLAETTEPVTIVAMECGYENPSHFATAFRRRYGVSPTRYRALDRR